ncbi:MAG TPA: bacillithiol biosynthesis cysteine-adding enzyme BshC [Oligoflexia bacterium]|nr:bacillithiol biosynthesis cysteine-adding enzyme BshC [Oligoflexia bacterium]HMP48974.1 bacillithiol biosynthesis cysteine-adding enzyme BshC [Oligoflexia bacterium]
MKFFAAVNQTHDNLEIPKSGIINSRLQKSSSQLSEDLLSEWSTLLIKSGATNRALDELKKLSKSDTLCIVGGQQIGIGLGPLLTIYKIASIDALSELLSKKLNHAIIPVFWLQTEDHDLEEISTITLPDSSGKTVITRFFPADISKNNRISVGAIRINDELDNTISSIKDQFRVTDDNEIFKTFTNCYQKNKTLSQAFISLYYKLFPESKVVIFDPRLNAFNKAGKQIFLKALMEHRKISELLENETKVLASAGYSVPINIRPDSPLFFFHPEGPDKSRYRLRVTRSDEFITPDEKVYSKKMLVEMINDSTNHFSSSALLRPLIQDYILPSVCFVGGETELAYIKQANPLYSLFSIHKPLAIPRARGLFIDEKIIHYIEKKSVLPDQLLSLGMNDLNRVFVDSNKLENKRKQLEEKLKQSLIDLENTLNNEGINTIPDLEKPLKKTLNTINESLSKLLSKYMQHIDRNNEIDSGRLQRISEILYPDNKPQERVFSGLWPFIQPKDMLDSPSSKIIFNTIKNAYDSYLAGRLK